MITSRIRKKRTTSNKAQTFSLNGHKNYRNERRHDEIGAYKKTSVFLSALGLVTLLVGIGITSIVSQPASAFHGNLINARGGQKNENSVYGSSSRIQTGTPSLNWLIGEWAYGRVLAGQDTPTHQFGEIGWTREFLTTGDANVKYIYKNPSGVTERVIKSDLGNLAADSYHTYAVLNNLLCDGTTATTRDDFWDICFDGTKIITLDLSFEDGDMFKGGGEVGSLTLPHGVQMGDYEMKENKIVTTKVSPSLVNLNNVTCLDHTPSSGPNPPTSGICPTDSNGVGENYRVTSVASTDNQWNVAD